MFNHIDDWLNVGTDQKVLRLARWQDSYEFMRLQLLDMMHDNEAAFSGSDRRAIAIDLLGTWLFVNNPILQSNWAYGNKLSYFIANLAANVGEIDIGAVGGDQMHGHFLQHGFTEGKIDNNTMVVVDNCDVRDNPQICRDMQRIAVDNQSMLYDNGSYSSNCQGRNINDIAGDKYGNFSIVRSEMKLNRQSIMNQYYLRNDVNEMFSCAVRNNCPKSRNNSTTPVVRLTNYYVVGPLPAPNADNAVGSQSFNIWVVLAYRGVSQRIVNNNNNSIQQIMRWNDQSINRNNAYLRFHHMISPNGAISRGFAPTNMMLSSLRGEIINSRNAAIDDKLRLYTELSAKFWGDFGLVFEAAGRNDVYVLTKDNFLKLLLAFFNINTIFNNTPYLANPRAAAAKVEYLNNSAPRFGNL